MSHPIAYSPTSLAETYEMLAERGQTARIIAGGTDLMVLMNSHLLDAPEFIDIWRVDELRGIADEGEAIRIGALTTYTQLIKSSLIQRYIPSLVSASRTIGAIQIQNRGTIGGNIVNASPAGDSLPVLAAFDAEVEIGSLRGLRRVSIDQFYTGYRKTVLEPDELVLAVRVPKLKDVERDIFRKVGTRRAQAISKVVMAVKVEISDGTIGRISIGIGSVAPTVIRAPQTEALLTNFSLKTKVIETFELIDKARTMITQEVAPISDMRSTEYYRRKVTGNVLANCLYQLLEIEPDI
jgi:CO/xanthine dehydrogenase FAD-binding subunit